MESPRRPKILKGALAHFDGETRQGRSFVFQYNPASLQRTMGTANPGSPSREAIRFTLTLDATDELERGDPGSIAVRYGIFPQLCALELFLQTTDDAGGVNVSSGFGSHSRQRPFTLFMWGAQRFVPVRMTDLQIREQMFDPGLHPIRAEVDVTLEVVLPDEYPPQSAAAKYLASNMATRSELAQLVCANKLPEDLVKENG